MISFGELQPYRVWFDYLKTCLLDDKLQKKVDREYYKSWNLNEIKNSKFDEWFKTHSSLFTSKGTIKIVDKITNHQAIILEIPTNFQIKEIQRTIPKILEGKVNKSTSRFVLTHQRKHIKTIALDSFLIAWNFKQNSKDKKLEEIWELTNIEIDKRQSKVKTLLQKGKLKRRKLQGIDYSQTGKSGKLIKSKNKSIIISRKILKAHKILENVTKGYFPGEYSDN